MTHNKPIHILRYGTVAEKEHLEKAISAYDYISLNGNTAAYVSSAVARFVVEKFFTRPEKGFFIDPITYAFQNNIDLLYTKSRTTGEKSIKKSIQKLIERYGYPTTAILSGKPISYEDFSDDRVIDTFCERVISFQYDLVYDHISQNDLQKYLDYVSPEQSRNLSQLRPRFLIAPYFYLDLKDITWREWLILNSKFAEKAKESAITKYNNIPVYAQIVISKEMIQNHEAISTIASMYRKLNCDGYTIWVDNLSEHEANYDELYGFMKLLKELQGKPVYNMYGGYFSILLTNKAIALLHGVSHGLEYGESRQVYPVGGGVPVSKYYFFPLHQRMDFTKSFYILENDGVIDTSQLNWGSSDKYYRDICKCSQCKSIIKKEMINFIEFESKDYYDVHRKNQIIRRKKASADTKKNCLYHYLLCKKIEFSATSRNVLENLTDEMISSYNRFNSCEALKKGELDYLKTWCRLLQSLEWRKDNDQR